jgi:hypothetical protein
MLYYFKQVKRGIVNFKPEEKIFGKPIPCNAILDLELVPGIPNKLYGECHYAHDDQLKIITGLAIVLIIYNKQMHYIPLTPSSDLLIIPTGSWHSLVNLNEDSIHYQNWMILKHQPVKKDYMPILVKHHFNLSVGLKAIKTKEIQIINF